MKSFGRVLRFVLGRVMLLLCSPRGAWPAVEEAAERAVSEASAEGSTAAAAPLGAGDAPGSGVEGACLSVVPAEGIAQPARKIPRLSLNFCSRRPAPSQGRGRRTPRDLPAAARDSSRAPTVGLPQGSRVKRARGALCLRTSQWERELRLSFFLSLWWAPSSPGREFGALIL